VKDQTDQLEEEVHESINQVLYALDEPLLEDLQE
jgi:hypothetical protein